MDSADIALRNTTYTQMRLLGRPPSALEIGLVTGSSADEVLAGCRRLHDNHALVLNHTTAEIRMLNPFSCVPSAYRVRADGRWWYANCAWDAFGILGALQADGRIETSCPDCGDPLVVEVQDGRPDDTSLVFHCMVAAREWWDDIVFT